MGELSRSEWWAARNAIVHTFGAYSRRHRKPGVRVLLWMSEAAPHAQYDPHTQPDFPLVDVVAVRDALFARVDCFPVDASADASRNSWKSGCKYSSFAFPTSLHSVMAGGRP